MQPSSPAATMSPDANLLLAALSEDEYRKLLPHLEAVALPSGKVISESGVRITHGYFPTTGIVSLLASLEGGTSTEIGVTGNEGLVGVSLLLDSGEVLGPPRRAVVQTAGHAYRLPAEVLAKQFHESLELPQLLLRYTQALITQIAQTAICNRHHRIAEQLCRWLLLRLDRLPGHELYATQEQIASLLGVRREGVTGVASELESGGIIRYGRGRIVVLDRTELERRACECYGVLRKEYDRLLACADNPKNDRMRQRKRRTLPQAPASTVPDDRRPDVDIPC